MAMDVSRLPFWHVKENYQVSVDLSAVRSCQPEEILKTLKQWQDYGIKIDSFMGTNMKIIFVRHGEPDYSMLDKLENCDSIVVLVVILAPLTGNGRSLAKKLLNCMFRKGRDYYFIVCDRGL